MAMLAAQEKGLYYPTPLAMVEAMTRHIKRPWPDHGIIFDPCIGEGAAAMHMAELLGKDWSVIGVEPDDQRVETARQTVKGTIYHGVVQDFNYFNQCDILFLNPPYDQAQDQHERMEHQFLRWTGQTVRPDGLLFWIVPERMMVDSWGEKTMSLLHRHRFEKIRIYRFTPEHYEAFNQVVLIAKKVDMETACYRNNNLPIQDDYLGDVPILESGAEYYSKVQWLKNRRSDFTFLSVQSKPKLERRPSLPNAENWSALSRFLNRPDGQVKAFTPLSPLSHTMAVLVVCSGLLNNTVIGDLLIKGGFRETTGVVDVEDAGSGGKQWKERSIPVTVFHTFDVKTLEFRSIDEELNPEEYQEFLAENARLIVDTARQQYPSLYDPAKHFINFNKFLMPPKILEAAETQGVMKVQMDRMSSLVHGFRYGHKVLELIGTPGTGKTLMSIGVIQQLIRDMGDRGKDMKVIVMCPASPNDLAVKWVKEINQVLNKKCARIIETITDVDKAFEESGNIWMVVRETQLKRANPWKQIRLPERGKPGQRHPICPKCFRKLVDYQAEEDSKTLTELGQYRHNLAAQEANDNNSRVMMVCNDQTDEDGKLLAVGCGESWWTRIVPRNADGTGRRHSPLCKYIKNRFKSRYFLIEDECHENKGVTGRGGASYHLTIGSRKALQLTGTFFNGKATGVFYMLMRGDPVMRELFDMEKPTEFTRVYGCMETSYSEVPKNRNHTASGFVTRKGRTAEAPGLKPGLVRIVLPRMTFLAQPDLDVDMVDYGEHTLFVETLPEHLKAYAKFEAQVKASIKEKFLAAMDGEEGAMRAAMAYRSWFAWAAHSALDNPLLPLHHECGNYIPPKLPSTTIFPKEEALIRLIHGNKERGRKTLLYVHQMASRDVSPRLTTLCNRFGLHGVIMGSDVKQRVAFVDRKMNHGFDFAITNHQLVRVGVDIVSTPSVVWYSLFRALNTLDIPQANKRPHRPHQTQNVDVTYLGVQGTVQAEDAAYIAEKVKVMQAFQGDAPNGLAMLETNATFQDQLAREVAEQEEKRIWHDSSLTIDQLAPMPPEKSLFPKSSKMFKPVKFGSKETMIGENGSAQKVSQVSFF